MRVVSIVFSCVCSAWKNTYHMCHWNEKQILWIFSKTCVLHPVCLSVHSSVRVCVCMYMRVYVRPSMRPYVCGSLLCLLKYHQDAIFATKEKSYITPIDLVQTLHSDIDISEKRDSAPLPLGQGRNATLLLLNQPHGGAITCMACVEQNANYKPCIRMPGTCIHKSYCGCF